MFLEAHFPKESDGVAIFLLIVIPICPRIQVKESRQRRRHLSSRRFVKSVLSQLIPRGGRDVAAKLLFLVHFDLTPVPYTGPEVNESQIRFFTNVSLYPSDAKKESSCVTLMD